MTVLRHFKRKSCPFFAHHLHFERFELQQTAQVDSFVMSTTERNSRCCGPF